MRLLRSVIITRKFTIIIGTLLFLFSALLILQIFVFKQDLIFELKSFCAHLYLFIIEKSANAVLSLLGTASLFENEMLYTNGVVVRGFRPHIQYEILVVISLTLIWLTKTTIPKKLLYTILFIIIHFFANLFYIIAGAYTASLNTQSRFILAIGNTSSLFMFVTLFFIWFRNHKKIIVSGLTRFKINTSLLSSDLQIILTIYSCILIGGFLIEIFDFRIWIIFLFTTAKSILGMLGYEAFVDNLHLVGQNGTIMMSKACLGFQMMLLFTVMIILTGDNNKARWKYIIAGLLFLNFINILRFVLLFIHLDRYGDYMLSIEAHNLYNFITYVIVFLLWILWFEKFADRKESDSDPGIVKKIS